MGPMNTGSLAAGKSGFQGELARVQQLDLRGPCLELHECNHLHDTETIEHAQPSAADTEQLDLPARNTRSSYPGGTRSPATMGDV